MSIHQFKITKYDPRLRDERGRLDDWTSISDVGRTFRGRQLTLADYLDVETKHLLVLISFMDEGGVVTLTAEGVESKGSLAALSEGQQLSAPEAIEVVRAMLRDHVWCRLTAGSSFYIHVGYDYYLYVGSGSPSNRSVEMAERLGLFVVRDFPSPHEPESH